MEIKEEQIEEENDDHQSSFLGWEMFKSIPGPSNELETITQRLEGL